MASEKVEHETTVLSEGSPSDETLVRLGNMFKIKDPEGIRNHIKNICQDYLKQMK